MSNAVIEFPPDFVFGSATSAHQVEGLNVHNDWWAHEHAAGTNAVEPSGAACDHYHRYADDFRLLRFLGQPAHRLSIEWSRLEPHEGCIDTTAVEHYRQVFASLREHDIEPWVTLHHFTLPQWFAERGGFARRENVAMFGRFVEQAARAYGDLVEHWCTINEPTMYALLAYRAGYFPPRRSDGDLAVEVLGNLLEAHVAASTALRAHARRAPRVGITLSVTAHEPLDPGSAADRTLAARRDGQSNEVSFAALRTGVLAYPERPAREIAGLRASSDFVGLQYYTRTRHDAVRGRVPPAADRPCTQMGWEIYPEGLPPLLHRASATGLPVYVTENGIACDDDRMRVHFIADHLAAVDTARRAGADVRGYFYWSTMDNFEWNAGYRPTFGLVAVDRTTLTRAARPSAYFFSEIIRERRLTPALVDLYTS